MKDIDEFETSLESSLDELSQESFVGGLLLFYGLMIAAIFIGGGIKSLKVASYYKDNKEKIDNFIKDSKKDFEENVAKVRKALTVAKVEKIIADSYTKNPYYTKDEYIKTFKVTTDKESKLLKTDDAAMQEDEVHQKASIANMLRNKSLMFYYEIFKVAASNIFDLSASNSSDDDQDAYDQFESDYKEAKDNIKKVVSGIDKKLETFGDMWDDGKGDCIVLKSYDVKKLMEK